MAIGGGRFSPVTIGGVTDNAGNTYAEAGAALSVNSVAGSVADIWYAMNSLPGATTVTIAPSSTITSGSAVIWEFSGADLSAPLDRTAILNSQAASAAPSGAPVTVSAGNDVVISLATAADVTGIFSGNPFVSDSTVDGNGWAHLVTSAPGTFNAQWNLGLSGTYASSTAAFKAAGTVMLTSNNALLAVPASVTVPVGTSTAMFTANTGFFSSARPLPSPPPLAAAPRWRPSPWRLVAEAEAAVVAEVAPEAAAEMETWAYRPQV